MGDPEDILTSALEILNNATPSFAKEDLSLFVDRYFRRRNEFLDLFRREGSPLYVIDRPVLVERAGQFMAAFQNRIDDVKFFFAMKSNNNPAIAETLIGCGYGLDVSSGIELNLALSQKARHIIFSGPGKTDRELELAADNSHRVIVLIDSFGELDRLNLAAHKAGVTVRAGIRLTTDENGLWRKFGIPLNDLSRFGAEAKSRKNIDLCGLQFHTSWNMNPDNQIAFMRRLGRTLADMDDDFRASIKFVDIGGGYWPPQGEWLQAEGTPEGHLRQITRQESTSPLEHFCLPATPIDVFAQAIGAAVREYIQPHVRATIYMEPGRWICHDSMHILLQVIDKKTDDLVITDAGTNAIGWERFETDYFPVLNLSRPGPEERQCHILGSLCTPHDVWGFAYFGEGIEPGDILMIPTQGAYTYSLRQNFIKPLPKTVVLDKGRDA